VEKAADFLARRTVTGFDIVWKEDVRRHHPGQKWIWQPGGFGVFDAGINALSIISRILPVSPFVTAAELHIPTNAEAPITAHVGFSSGKAEFEWRCDGVALREMTITTDVGHRLALTNTAGRLAIDDVVVIDGPRTEYADIYAHFDTLLNQRTSFIDELPPQLVADAFLVGRRIPVAAFQE